MVTLRCFFGFVLWFSETTAWKQIRICLLHLIGLAAKIHKLLFAWKHKVREDNCMGFLNLSGCQSNYSTSLLLGVYLRKMFAAITPPFYGRIFCLRSCLLRLRIATGLQGNAYPAHRFSLTFLVCDTFHTISESYRPSTWSPLWIIIGSFVLVVYN